MQEALFYGFSLERCVAAKSKSASIPQRMLVGM
jgi:hypothetical protein